jgi:hypothetical protein
MSVKTNKTPTKRTKANYLGQLNRLNEYRQGNHYISEDDAGRAMLMAQLRCKLKDDDAKERAPWITDAELVVLKRQARKIAFKQIGELVGLKHLERWHDDVKMFSWPACDITPREAARFKAERDRQNARKRQAKRRNSVVKMQITNKRGDAILEMLKVLPKPLIYQTGNAPLKGWVPVSALVKEAADCNAFRRPDGYPMECSLREPVHRVLRALKASGQIETTERPGQRGMVMYVLQSARELGSNVTYLRTTVTDFASVT